MPHACCIAPAHGTFMSDLVGLSPALGSGTAPRADAALDTAAAHHQDQQARAEAEERVTLGLVFRWPPMMGHCPA